MYRRFLPYLRPVRGMLSAGLSASVVSAVMQWAAPWPLKFMFDNVINHHRLPGWLRWLPAQRGALLWIMSAAMLAVAAVLALADYLSTRLVATAGQRVVFQIRCDLFRHIESQGSGFHQRRQLGDLLARLGGDVQAIQGAMVNAVPTLVRNVLTLGGMIAIMLIVDWRFALLALTLVPVLLVTTRYFLRTIRTIQRRARRADGQASAVAQEVLSSMTVVQAFGAEDLEAARYAAAAEEGLEENRRAIIAQAQFTPLMTLAMTLSTVIVVYFGIRAITAHQLTAGDLLVFMAYLRGMYSPVRQLSKLAGVVGRAHAAAERVTEILDIDERVPERVDARHVARARGAITLHAVTYAYPGGGVVLNGVDLEIPAGTRQALVGSTGSGKSTILRLVPRFVDPSSGSVRLDGLDVADLDLADLRRQVAFVPQEPYLFRATVWENILYGSTDTDRERAVAVARRAGLHEVIETFRDGYDTFIGERGATLSGGQRQCVAVARAMARNAPVLLLDEPTTGLDAQLESVVLDALKIAADGRTTIIVSHQLSGVRWADQIAVLTDGRISESGTHHSLMAARHAYWNLNRFHANQSDASRSPRSQRVDLEPTRRGES